MLPTPAHFRFVRRSLGLLAAGLSAAPLAGQAQDAPQTLSGNDVAIYNIAGRVRLESGTGRDVTIEVRRGGRDAAALKLATSEVRGRNAFRVVYPTGDDIVYRDDTRSRGTSTFRVNDDGTWGGENGRGWSGGDRVRVKYSGSGTEAWADLVVRVPAGRKVAMYLGVGEVVATGVDGDVMIDVASAHVSSTGSRGRLDVDAGSGGVDIRDASLTSLRIDNGSGGLDLSNVTSDVCDLDTGSGGVRGTGAACGELRVDVGSGSVRLDDIRSSNVSVDAGSGGVTLGMRSSPRELLVDAGSGGVTLTLPSNTSADLDIATGSGGITSDFAVRTTRVERRRLRGTIGDGDGRIRIETGSGSVRLRKGA